MSRKISRNIDTYHDLKVENVFSLLLCIVREERWGGVELGWGGMGEGERY